MASRVRFIVRRLRRCLPAVLSLAGCGPTELDQTLPQDAPEDGTRRGGGAEQSELVTPCGYDAALKELNVVMEGGESVIITKRSADSALLVNGATCGLAKVANATRINIVEKAGATGDQTVLVDLSNGIFGTGRAGRVGIHVDFGVGNDTFSLRGSAGNDYVWMAVDGIATNSDPNPDIDVIGSGTISYQFALGGGADVFGAQGGLNRLGGPFLQPLVVYGGDGNDRITGGDGADSLFGGPGNDAIAGGLGDDTCSGDDGEDVFDERRASVSNGDDVYLDSAGATDTVDYSARTSAVVVDIEALASGTNDDGELALSEHDQVVSGIDVVIGGTGDDRLTGDAQGNALYGGAGADTLAGGLGADTLAGQAGDDVLDEGGVTSGGDRLSGGDGSDLVDYGARTLGVTVTMDGKLDNDGQTSPAEGDNVAADVERCYGGSGSDDITGNVLANTLRGGAGADVLRGGDGSDLFDDPLANNGGDVMFGGAGYDRVDYGAQSAPLTITMDGLAADDGLANEGDNIGNDIEACHGGSGNDLIVGGSGDNDLAGGGGADTLRGGLGNDVLAGGAGNDLLEGGAGEDTLDGEASSGNDVLDCGTGDADIGLYGDVRVSCEL